MPDASFWFVWIFLTICLVFVCLIDFMLRYLSARRRRRNDDDEEEIYYDVLSAERRLELDERRSAAILRRLGRFALALEAGNMLKKPGDAESSPAMDDDTSTLWDEEWKRIIGDVETGIAAPAKTVHEKSSYFDDKDDCSEYTHLLIPRPGRAIANGLGRALEDCGVDNEDEKTTRRSHLLLKKFIRTSKVSPDNMNARKEHAEEGSSCTTDEADTVNDPVTENRAAPIYCAVCLTKYEVSNRVCWSSNSECSHVFHEDCMLHWLVVLGRKRSLGKRFPRNPSEGKLLEFDLTCPCCRQDFISRDADLGTEENVRSESYS